MSMLNIAKFGDRNDVFDILCGIDHDMSAVLSVNEYFCQKDFDKVYQVLRAIGIRDNFWLDGEVAPLFLNCCKQLLAMVDLSEGVLKINA